ncbi:hypothetical protein AB733_19580 [Photobacterium swingsii]|uniref:Uncharacterized protein n=1 Tax=Photobacterium swingsii TaxID=680026 RepID=A0A0J8V7M9_9GAMM|nr:hypothetical protein [Photobacterium swingsii]KMV29182.1 hypothetical protein AB733_19580 [Photobacterium swingsii]PSW19703.1 hypothetical protein C9I94_23120 [Photobacterium swingsii]
MKPNFLSYQLTDDFIETVKTNPTVDVIDELLDSQFNEVASSNNKLNWDAPYYGPFRYLREMAGIFGFLFMYGIGGFLKEDWGNVIPSLDGMYFISLIPALMAGYVAWSTFAEFLYFYRFNDNFIAVKSYKNEPDFSFKVARLVGWLGSITCIFLALFFGPIIFIGAGGFALTSFYLINIKRRNKYHIIPYNSILYIQRINDENELKLIIKEQVSRCDNEYAYVYEKTSSVSLYLYDREKMDEVINLINKKVGYDVEYYESEDYESSVNLHKKSRELGTPLNRVTINKETLEMTHDVFTKDV